MDPVSFQTRLKPAPSSPSSGQAEGAVGDGPGARELGRLPGDVRALLEATRQVVSDRVPRPLPAVAPALAPWGTALGDALLSGALDGELRTILEAQTLAPGLDGEQLRGRLKQATGLGTELLDGSKPRESAIDLLSVLERDLFGRLEPEDLLTDDSVERFRSALRVAFRASLQALRAAAGDGLSPRALGSLAPIFAAEVASRLSPSESPQERPQAWAHLRWDTLLQGREALLVRALYSGASAGLRRSLEQLAREGARDELGLRLERAAPESDAGTWKKLQAALEQERLGAELRQRQDDSLSWSMPLADGAQWAAVELLLGKRQRNRGAGAGAGASYRVSVATDLSKLGPLRVDLLMGSKHVAVKLEVQNPSTAQMLRQALPALEALLGVEGQRVVVAVVESPQGPEPVHAPVERLVLVESGGVDLRG